MPDCIVRFGGNNIRNAEVVSTFASLLRQPGKSHLIVVSATRKIQDMLTSGISLLCSSACKPAQVSTAISDELLQLGKRYGIRKFTATGPFLDRLEVLLRGIHFTGDFSPALRDQVISFGEKITASLFCEILNKQGLEARVYLPEEFGLRVSEEYGNASILENESACNISNSLFQGIALVPGSYGLTYRGKLARLGERASDYTAAALAALLKAPQLELWQIGKPFKTADDSLVNGTAYIESLTYAEASELSYFNNSQIHPRIVEPLIPGNIPVAVYELAGGKKILRTRINGQSIVSPGVVKCVAHTDDIAILRLTGPGVGFKPGILARVTTAFSDRRINIRSVITAQTCINILVDRDSAEPARQICAGLKLSSVSSTELAEQVSLIAVIGHGMQTSPGISARLFDAVARKRINVLISGSGASDLASYLVVEEKDKRKALQEIHYTFFNP
ncbi:MAG: hypothetical protein AB7D05_06215 [Mangrovibacterium sp.]